MTATIGAAVVGLGVGEQHARAFMADPRAELRWIYDFDRARAERLVAESGARVASDFAEILADPAVDIVSLASYDHDHADQVVRSLRAGKHCFVEKPLCRTAVELARIVRTWEDSGRPVLRSNLVLRAAPLFVWLRDAIGRGEFGQVYAFDGDYLYGRLLKITEGWRSNVPDYSVMAGGGIHLIDLMMWLTGQRPARVCSAGNRIVTSGTAFRGDDFACATFTFPSGLIARISANFGSVHRHQHVIRVFGTRATFISDDAGARLHTGRDAAPHVRTLEMSPLSISKGSLIPAFIDAVGSGAEDHASAMHEFSVVSACIASDDARLQDRTVSVAYP